MLSGGCSNSIIRETAPTPLKIGIIADCQYADQPDNGQRLYRRSPQKLQACVDSFNRLNLDHVFHLGDFIDTDQRSFDTLHPIMARLKASYTHVLGNHDFSVTDSLKTRVPKIMGLEARYFTLEKKGWKFIVLDGNEISTYAHPENSVAHEQSQQIYYEQYAGLPTWNGAMSEAQLDWLKHELDSAETNYEQVILLCHFPIHPEDSVHQLWNASEVLQLISEYRCVKAWMNGHNHAGNYGKWNGVHFITFRGMVDTEDNSFARLTFESDKIHIQGYGREPDRTLNLDK